MLTLQIDTAGLTPKRYGDRWSGSFDITVAQTLATGEHVRVITRDVASSAVGSVIIPAADLRKQ